MKTFTDFLNEGTTQTFKEQRAINIAMAKGASGLPFTLSSPKNSVGVAGKPNKSVVTVNINPQGKAPISKSDVSKWVEKITKSLKVYDFNLDSMVTPSNKPWTISFIYDSKVKPINEMSEDVSKSQLKRIETDFQRYAGDEKITIEEISGTFYAYGSELATLRILMKYRNNKSANQGYSKNLKKFYFSLST